MIKSVVSIMLLGFSGKILGFVRELLIGFSFGSGTTTDAFFMALSIIVVIENMITLSLSTIIIPILTEIEIKHGHNQKNTYINYLVNIFSLISLFILIISWAATPIIITLIAPGFKNTNQFALTVFLLRIGLPIVWLASLRGIFLGLLQSEKKFIQVGAIAIPLNLVYIFYLLFLSDYFSVSGLMVSAVIRVLFQLTFLSFGLKEVDYKYELKISFSDNYIKRTFLLILPIIISTGIADINIIIDRILASGLVEGSISALNYATKLDDMARGLFITAIITVLYPKLSDEVNKANISNFKKTSVKGLNAILIMAIPATLGIISLSEPIVKIAFERGAFDSTATKMTSDALVFTAVGMVGTSASAFLNNIYYSLQDTKTPVIFGSIAVIINIILNLILVKYMAHVGLALATSISASVLAVMLLYGIIKKKGSFGFVNSFKCFSKSLVASIAMGLFSHVIYSFLSSFYISSAAFDLINWL